MLHLDLIVVRPYDVYLFTSSLAFNEECSTAENNYENGALFKYVVPGQIEFGQNKLILDDQPAYDKAKELYTLLEKYYSVIFVIGDLYHTWHIFCENYQITHGTMDQIHYVYRINTSKRPWQVLRQSLEMA